MARVRLDDIIEHAEREMKGALAKTVEELWPDKAPVDRSEMLRVFRNKLRGEIRDWLHVPDRMVQAD